jgi:hypothetical protein
LALFEKTDPDLKAQRDIEGAVRSKRRDRDGLAERLGIAEAAIASHKAKARELARDGADDKMISVAEGKMRDAQDRVQTLTGAIVDVDKTIGELERTINEIIDKRCRTETSIAVTAMADRLAKAQVAHAAAALELELAAKEGGILIPESVAVHQFVLDARTQLVPAIEMVVAGLRAHAQGVLSGHGPASLPRPAAPPVQLKVVPAEPMQTVFIKRNAKYLDQAGRTVTIAGNRRHSLPQKLAEEALSTNLALPLSDRRIRDLEYNAPAFFVPSEEVCEWVGAPAKAKPAPKSTAAPVMSSHFEPLDRGKPYTVPIPRGPELVAMGSRSMPEDNQS